MATFKTRARTLDMLGRQQIAGIPTAISELFKNAHDAYADKVEIDYFRSDGLFVLRDNGIGMNYDDFVNRWLTIGTESKFDQNQLPPQDPNKEKRPILGEKGIGRLAVATIGPQLLVLTREKGNDGASELTAAFLNWGVFEWPHINLEEIEIPIRSFSSGLLPSALEVAEMVEDFRVSAESAGSKIENHLLEKLTQQLNQFDIDPQQIDSYLKKPSLLNGGSGTHFIIKPAWPLLADDIDGDPSTDKVAGLKKASPLKKALIGFSNTMNPKSNKSPLISAKFRDHKTEELTDELIANDEFFTPDEFQNTDHRISGVFDEFGQFRGSVSIYGERRNNHVIPWSGGHGERTQCGPFSIDFAAFEGESRHSTIPHNEHTRLALKTELLGGLYIYRNGIRILPYGDTDYDWLDIELRRTKSAYYYYFSHRKMFGAVDINLENNRQLHEKAGREGFQENKAYRQFRSILRNFLVQMAADFFRKEGIYSASFARKKEGLSKEDKAKKHREKQVSKKKKIFEANLNSFFEELNNDEPGKRVMELTERLEKELQQSSSVLGSQLSAHKLLDLESKALSDVRNLEDHYRITRPRIGLSKSSLRDWGVYNTEFSSLQKNVFKPARNIIEELIAEKAQKEQLALGRNIRTQTVLDNLSQEARKTVRKLSRELKDEANTASSNVKDVTENSLISFETELREILIEFQRIDFAKMPSEAFAETRKDLETKVLNIMEKQVDLLRSVLEQLQKVDFTGDNSIDNQLVAYEQSNLLLKEEVEVGAQLAQLGMAIEIINHEFSGAIRSVRNGLRRLKAWADANENLAELYNSIRTSFDHLDGYMSMFTPLQRRLYRKKIRIQGSEIRFFLEELFGARLSRHNISFMATKSFDNSTIIGFPSNFYPVFMNLMDNAIFWLSQQNPKLERTIELDERSGILLISDNGPGINIRDKEAIFEFGFSRKPGGQGLGLYIGRETLRRVDYDLQLVNLDSGTTFALVPTKDQNAN